MKLHRLTPTHAVIAYFACFALGWAILAWLGYTAAAPPPRPHALVADPDPSAVAGWMLLLAAHAASVAVLAWLAPRALARHGFLAVLWAGLPLVALVALLWLVPAFFYVIADLHVWLAVRHETLGRLQAPARRSAQTGET